MSSPWTEVDAYHWRHLTGRYFVERSLVRDGWVFLAWHKPQGGNAECISPERRQSFHAAAADCAAHHKQQRQAA